MAHIAPVQEQIMSDSTKQIREDKLPRHMLDNLHITEISNPLEKINDNQKRLNEALRRATALPQISDPLKKLQESQKELNEALRKATALPQIPNQIQKLQESRGYITTAIRNSRNSFTSATPLTKPATLGKLVREKRKELKLSQEKFADLTGVGRRFISELERGKPSLEFGLVLQVCEAAGIDILAKRK